MFHQLCFTSCASPVGDCFVQNVDAPFLVPGLPQDSFQDSKGSCACAFIKRGISPLGERRLLLGVVSKTVQQTTHSTSRKQTVFDTTSKGNLLSPSGEIPRLRKARAQDPWSRGKNLGANPVLKKEQQHFERSSLFTFCFSHVCTSCVSPVVFTVQIHNLGARGGSTQVLETASFKVVLLLLFCSEVCPRNHGEGDKVAVSAQEARVS